MSTSETQITSNAERLAANPWFVMIVGFSCAVAAFCWARLLGDDLSFIRFLLILVGFLATGVSLWIRLQSQQESFLNSLSPQLIRGLTGMLILLFAGLSIALFGALNLSIAGVTWIPWRPGSLIVVNALTLPTSIAAAYLLRKEWPDAKTLDKSRESAILLLITAINLWLFSWALYIEADPYSWDSIQLVFGVFAMVALLAAPLVAVTQTVRRVMITLFVFVHFGGILSAVFAAPPAPHLVEQLWLRIYRPYLEFLYMNNAYHFYAPDPGPANYLWFRVVYEDGQGNEDRRWLKIPNISDDGWHRHEVALVYSRLLAITERASQKLPTPPIVMRDGSGNPILAPFFSKRSEYAQEKELVVGKANKKMIIPFHDGIPQNQQYGRPNSASQGLINTYTKHVAGLPHPKDSKWKFKYVKIYRVRHELPHVPGPYLDQWLPNDPLTYRAYYVGDYDKDANLLNPESPFLYWMLPTLRRSHDQLIDHARRHARDPRYIYRYKDGKASWITD